MDINRMRLGLVYIFKESKNIGSQSKLQLVNFIESADEHQLKMLALDGQIAGKDTLDESAKTILDERFVAATHIEESLKKASIEAVKMLSEFGGATLGAAAATVGAAAYMRHKYCKEKYGKNEEKRKKCLNDRSM